MSKDDSNAQKKEAYNNAELLDTLEHKLKEIIEEKITVINLNYIGAVKAIIANISIISEDNKVRYKEFLTTFNDNRKTIEKSKLQSSRYQKQVIVINLIAIFLFCADVQIQSAKIGSEDGSISLFGLSLTGLDSFEVIIGFLILLLGLHVRLIWVILTARFIPSEIYFLLSSQFQQEEKHIRKIFLLIIKSAIYINDTDQTHDEKKKMLKDDAFVRFSNKNKRLIAETYNSFFLITSVFLTLISVIIALSSVQNYYGLHVFLFLLPTLLILWVELYPKPLSKLIKHKTDDLV